MKYKDYYAALGVGRDADEETIRKAYRKLARQHHPDVAKEAGAEERFKEIGEAYGVLKDPEKRAAYDRLGQRRGGADFTPPPEWRQAYASDGHAFEDIDLSDLLAAMARGGGVHRRGPRAPVRGGDVEATVRLTLEQAHHGTTLSLDVDHEDGTRTLAVTVPAGMTEGQRLRLRGKGLAGRHGGGPGDLYLHIDLLPHAVFRPDGHDLYFDLALAPWEAALGGEVEVPTLDGPVLLTVPGGTSSGRKLRMRGRGLATGRGGRGDLYAVAQIATPASLTARERELFEQLAGESRFRPRGPLAKESDHATDAA